MTKYIQTSVVYINYEKGPREQGKVGIMKHV